VVSQLFVQRCVVVSHAKLVGQSASDLQPQNVRPFAVSHPLPFAFPTHDAHIGSELVTAHVAWTSPTAHFPDVASQQPP
jgi:hypothetical protein